MAQATYTPNPGHTDTEALAYFQALVQALATQNSGASEPVETFPYMIWMDTGASPAVIRQRNAADTAWLSLPLFNLATTAQAQNGIGNALMTPALVKAAITAQAVATVPFTGSKDVAAGDVTKISNDAVFATNGATDQGAFHYITSQAGSVRFTYDLRNAGGNGDAEGTVKHTRGGVVLTSDKQTRGSSSWESHTYDFSIQAGDRISLYLSHDSGFTAEVRNMRLKTAGVTLLPGDASYEFFV